MKIGILSDTHDNKQNTRKILQTYKQKNISTILHAGDLISPFMLDLFTEFNLFLVQGNNDGDIYRIMKLKPDQTTFSDQLLQLRLDNKTIAVYHGTSDNIRDALIKSGQYDIVVTGHTHEAKANKHKNTLAINPGTAHGFEDKGTAMILDTETREVNILKV